MQTFFSVQSALLPVEPVYKLLVKAGSYQPVSTALNTHLYCYPHCFTIYIYGLVSTSSYQVLIYPQACTANPALLRCTCEDKVTCPPSLSQITAHPLTVQNITRFGCKSTWIPPIWPAPLFSHSAAPFLPMKSVITSVCKEDDSGRCGGPSGQTPHGLP